MFDVIGAMRAGVLRVKARGSSVNDDHRLANRLARNIRVQVDVTLPRRAAEGLVADVDAPPRIGEVNVVSYGDKVEFRAVVEVTAALFGNGPGQFELTAPPRIPGLLLRALRRARCVTAEYVVAEIERVALEGEIDPGDYTVDA